VRPALLLCATLIVLGAVLLAAGWYQASGEVTYSDQVPGLGLALGGVISAALAAAVLLLGGRRAVHRRQVAALERVWALPSPSPTHTPGSDGATLVAGAGLRRFHRAECELAQGRAWVGAARAIHEREGREPCGMCRP